MRQVRLRHGPRLQIAGEGKTDTELDELDHQNSSKDREKYDSGKKRERKRTGDGRGTDGQSHQLSIVRRTICHQDCQMQERTHSVVSPDIAILFYLHNTRATGTLTLCVCLSLRNGRQILTFEYLLRNVPASKFDTLVKGVCVSPPYLSASPWDVVSSTIFINVLGYLDASNSGRAYLLLFLPPRLIVAGAGRNNVRGAETPKNSASAKKYNGRHQDYQKGKRRAFFPRGHVSLDDV